MNETERIFVNFRKLARPNHEDSRETRVISVKKFTKIVPARNEARTKIVFKLCSILPLTLDWVKLSFAQPERLWRNFEQLVIQEKIQTLLETKLCIWRKLNRAVRSMSPHIS